MSDSLFSADVETVETRYLGRQWLGDLLDLALGVLLGWALLRAADVTRTPGTLAAAGFVMWSVMCLLGGVSGWTPGLGLTGLRRTQATGGAPGLSRGAGRIPLALVELWLAPILQRRLSDRSLGLRTESLPLTAKAWRGGLLWLAGWGVLVIGAVWLMRVPTRTEALEHLKTLNGWKCCHGRVTPAPDLCTSALSRAVREARGGDARAQSVVAECPAASEALAP